MAIDLFGHRSGKKLRDARISAAPFAHFAARFPPNCCGHALAQAKISEIFRPALDRKAARPATRARGRSMHDDAAREAAFARAYRMIRTTIERSTDFGQRLLVGDFTRASGLSPTPVREALSRLVGEGLIEEHRGGGYYVPRLDARDVMEFYSLSRALAMAALAEGGRPETHRTRRFAAAQADLPEQPEAKIAYWFERIAIASGNRLLADETHRLNGRMSGVRRAELAVVADFADRLDEIAGLVEAGDQTAQAAWIERYCRDGRDHSEEIADWLSA